MDNKSGIKVAITKKIKDQKIDELNLQVQPDEVYNFLLLSPPVAFQNNLKELGLYNDNEGNFDLDTYQYAVRNGNLPDTTRSLLLIWENYLKTFLADRKLQSFFNNLNSISDYEIINDYKLLAILANGRSALPSSENYGWKSSESKAARQRYALDVPRASKSIGIHGMSGTTWPEML